MSQTECTVYRHAWFPVPAEWDPPFMGDIVTLRCERCGSERREIWQPNTGALLYRRYVRTAGWFAYPRDQRPTMDDFRAALIKGRRPKRRTRKLAVVK